MFIFFLFQPYYTTTLLKTYKNTSPIYQSNAYNGNLQNIFPLVDERGEAKHATAYPTEPSQGAVGL